MLLSSRQSYGVGQVIVVGFDEAVPDRAAAEKTLTVTTSPAVEGSWHWYGDRDVHWRPKEYWKPGTQVTVRADVYGVDLGGGLYGQQDANASFTIGQSKIAIADDRTFQISVYVDGQPVKTAPTAMGLHQTVTLDNGQKVDLRTRSGVHVVLGNDQKVRMTSKSWGLSKGEMAYDEDVFWTTHISYAGEYIHAAPWSVAQQGRSDASHGCLNVNTANAQWFYNNFGPGDVVDVRNTGLALDSGDGITDWNVPWDQWVAGSALN
jgi:lipoprotein-anchoring transpeptidase ErfK/SrfK